MQRWLNTVLLLLPLALALGLADWGARILFATTVAGLAIHMVEAEALGPLIGFSLGGFFAALFAGSVLVVWWGWARLADGEVVLHLFIGRRYGNRACYARADDPDGPVVELQEPGGSHTLATTGFDLIYRRVLLVRSGPGDDGWERMLSTNIRNLLWPIPVSFMLLAASVGLFWQLYATALAHRTEVTANFATAVRILGVHVVVGGELLVVLLAGAFVALAAMIVLAVRTARWSRAAEARFMVEGERGAPRLQPLPEVVKPGAILNGTITDSHLARSEKTAKRRQRCYYFLRFDRPFRPPAHVGFRFDQVRGLDDLVAYLEERRETGVPIKVEVQDDADLSILPLTPAGERPSQMLKDAAF